MKSDRMKSGSTTRLTPPTIIKQENIFGHDGLLLETTADMISANTGAVVSRTVARAADR